MAEIWAVIISIHSLYGRKTSLNIYTVGFVFLEVIYMIFVNHKIFPKETLPIIYTAFIVYVLVEFRDSFVNSIYESLISILVVTAIQMIFYFPTLIVYYYFNNEDLSVLVINSATCVFLYFLRNNDIFSKLSQICKKKELRAAVCILICGGILTYYLVQIKTKNEVSMDVYSICILFIITVVYVVMRWQKSSYEVELKEKQIEIARMCNESFRHLIDVTRKNQHEFNNHLTAIYGMIATIDNYDELVKRQREYGNRIIDNSKYSKILFCIKDAILAGFVYHKVSFLSDKGIDISFEMAVNSEKIEYIPVFDLNEIIGILLDNAADALEGNFLNRRIHIDMIEYSDKLSIAVRNISRKYKHHEITKFFEKGYSTKGEERGLGLSKIKDLQKRYHYDIYVDNKEIQEQNWLEFRVNIKK